MRLSVILRGIHLSSFLQRSGSVLGLMHVLLTVLTFVVSGEICFRYLDSVV